MARLRTVAVSLAALLAAHFSTGPLTAGTIGYVQQNLVSDIPGVAAHTDPNLINPWGIAFSAASPMWVSDNGAGVSTLYQGSGTALALVVTVPGTAGGPGAPTGVVFNGGVTFNADRFIFATEDGTVAGWKAGTVAAVEVDNSGAGAVYKGLAFNATTTQLYAANFNAGTIDVFNSTYAPVTLPGAFTDPNLPAGYAPFNIVDLGTLLYVTYAQQDAARHDDVAGAGHGFVDVYSASGVLLQRLISGGVLNSPWGMALAPGSFGALGGDLLVGNFGDGTINAFNPATGAFLGTLSDSSGKAIVNPGLWGLAFGNGAQGTLTSTLYFTAGIPGPDDVEDHGLFGSLAAEVPEPGGMTLVAMALIGLALNGSLRRNSAKG